MKIEWTIKIDGEEHSAVVTVTDPGPQILEKAAELLMLTIGEHLSIRLMGVEADTVGFPLYGSRLHTTLVSKSDYGKVVEAVKAHKAEVAAVG